MSVAERRCVQVFKGKCISCHSHLGHTVPDRNKNKNGISIERVDSTQCHYYYDWMVSREGDDDYMRNLYYLLLESHYNGG